MGPGPDSWGRIWVDLCRESNTKRLQTEARGLWDRFGVLSDNVCNQNRPEARPEVTPEEPPGSLPEASRKPQQTHLRTTADLPARPPPELKLSQTMSGPGARVYPSPRHARVPSVPGTPMYWVRGCASLVIAGSLGVPGPRIGIRSCRSSRPGGRAATERRLVMESGEPEVRRIVL